MSVVMYNYLHLATSISVHNKRGIARHKKRISVHNGQESGHNGVYVYTKSPFLDITVDLIRNDCAVKTVKMLPTIE